MSQILTVAASSAPTWSSLFDWWDSLTVLQWAAVVSAAILAVGAVIEYKDKIKLLTLLAVKWMIRRSTPFDRCTFKKILTHSLGPILVVAGIAGEVVFEGRAFILEDRQERQARTLVGSLQDEAAAFKLKEDALEIKAGELNNRLDVASNQMGVLEGRTSAQGPRAKLLNKAAPRLVKELTPFATQRVGLFVCGQQGSAHQETLDTWGAIANILDSDTVLGVTGAKWKEVPTNLNFAGNCGAAGGLGQGIMVFVSKHASKSTLEAANVLGHGLARILPPSPNKMPILIDPDFTKLMIDRGSQDKNAPWVSVALDPDSITVLIGEHP